MSAPPPFGIILPSRPVLTNAAIISSTQYAFTFPSKPTFSHIVVFLLPGAVLPMGTLTGVYLQMPNSHGFKLLGAIGTEKPSAIFKINASSNSGSGSGGDHGITNGAFDEEAMEDAMTDPPPPLPPSSSPVGANSTEIILGLSIEPAATIAAQLETLKASQTSLVHVPGVQHMQSPPSALSTKVLAQRIIKNAYNFLGSFAGSAGPGRQEVVPLKSFQDWWTKFERRVENDPGFLEREGSGD